MPSQRERAWSARRNLPGFAGNALGHTRHKSEPGRGDILTVELALAVPLTVGVEVALAYARRSLLTRGAFDAAGRRGRYRMSTSVQSFAGFPAEGVQFLRELAANNEKHWFEPRREVYVRALQAPAVALVVALGERLRARFPEISYDTRTNGGGSLMRLHRDTRFSADKSPYKTNVAMMFSGAAGGKMTTPGFGLQLTPERVELIAGVFGFEPEALEAYRAAVLDDWLGPQLEEAAASVRSAGAYQIEGAGYKRVPAGLPADHPRAAWLKHKGLFVLAPPIGLDVAQTPGLVDAAMAHFEAMAPVQQWIARALQ